MLVWVCGWVRRGDEPPTAETDELDGVLRIHEIIILYTCRMDGRAKICGEKGWDEANIAGDEMACDDDCCWVFIQIRE